MPDWDADSQYGYPCQGASSVLPPLWQGRDLGTPQRGPTQSPRDTWAATRVLGVTVGPGRKRLALRWLGVRRPGPPRSSLQLLLLGRSRPVKAGEATA